MVSKLMINRVLIKYNLHVPVNAVFVEVNKPIIKAQEELKNLYKMGFDNEIPFKFDEISILEMSITEATIVNTARKLAEKYEGCLF